MRDAETAGSAERQLFVRALEKPAGKERVAFLDGACGGNPDLRRRLEALLQQFEALGTFLEKPAVSASDSPHRTPAPPAPELLQDTVGMGALTEKAGDRIGRYKLLQKIGEGGCGIVYMAEQEEPVRRRVALKVIKIGMDTKQVIARFEAERQALALMDHPNIAKVLDAGATDTGRPYFVMELVRGTKITEYCDQNNLTTRQRLELFIQICRAIQHAHQKGIIHRDIKPSNILVTLHDGIPVPKVIDFGIAKATTDVRLTDKTLFTHFEQFIGTPAYMSPEQAEMGGLDIDTRTDIYSLGVLLYELLTGKTPFDSKELLAAGLDEMRRTIREKEPVRPSTRLSTMLQGELTTTARRRACEAPKLIHALRGDLDWIVMKSLEKDRTRRYETANVLAMDIQRHLSNETVLARPPSRVYRLGKMVRRNKLAFGAAASVALALIAGVIGSAWQAARATNASKQALTNAQAAKQAQAKEATARLEAEQNLYNSLVREARATRVARRPGYRDVVFKLLIQARALRHDVQDPVELRCEASQCLGDFVGLTPTAFRDFPANIQATCLDSKGTLAAFILENSTIYLCNVPSGEIVARLRFAPVLKGWDFFGSRDLCFSPDANSLLAVHQPDWVCRWTKSPDGQWAETGEETKVSGAFACLSTAEHLFLAAVDVKSHQVELRDPATKTLVRTIQYAQEIQNDLTASLTRDNQFLAIGGDSASNTAIVQIWDLATEQSILRQEPRLTDLDSLNFSDDGRYLGCISSGGGRIYAEPAWQLVEEVRDPFDAGGPTQIIFASQPGFVAWPLIFQNGVRLLDFTKNEDIAVLKEPRRAEQALFFANGKFLLTSGGRQARIYQLNTPEKLSLTSEMGGVTGVAFSPKEPRVASVGKDNTIKVWDSSSGLVVWSNQLSGEGETVAYSPDGEMLATGARPTLVCLWDAKTGRLLRKLDTPPDGTMWSVQFSPDGRYLAVADGTFGVSVWSLNPEPAKDSGVWVQPTLLTSFTGNCFGLAFSADSRHLAFMDQKKTDHHEVDVWDFTRSVPPRIIATNLSTGTHCQAFTLDGRCLLSTDTHRALVSLDLVTGKELSRLVTEEVSQEESDDEKRPRQWGDIPNFTLSPDGTKVAIAPVSRQGVDVWDYRTRRRLYSMPDQNGSVWDLAWSADGHHLAVSRSNGDISVWNLQEVEQALASLGLSP